MSREIAFHIEAYIGTRLYRLAALCLALLLSLACGNGGGTTTAPAPPRAPAPAPAPPPAPAPTPWTQQDYERLRQAIEVVWTVGLPAVYGYSYSQVSVLQGYSSSYMSPCGRLGPWNAFYCPSNAGIYYHQPFLHDIWKLGGDLGPAFVVAHEFGHHVSWLLGWEPGYNMSTKQNELQADCFSGTFAGLIDETTHEWSSSELDGAARAVISTGSPNYTWFDPGIHGTRTQRLQAWNAGFRRGPYICTEPSWLGQFPLAEEEMLAVPLGEGATILEEQK